MCARKTASSARTEKHYEKNKKQINNLLLIFMLLYIYFLFV